MFAQANSEHCRHKIFNATWIVDGEPQRALAVRDDPHDARGAIRSGTVLAYADNAAVHGRRATRSASSPARTARYRRARGADAHLMKVETHNHPTAISPFPGAATGVGRRDPRRGRDRARRQAEGRSHRLLGVEPAHSRAFDAALGGTTPASPAASPPRSRSCSRGRSARASFNNEFGRPNLAGYFRTFEMPAGGVRPRLSQADHDRRRRRQHPCARSRSRSPIPPGALLVQLGGPGMLIGMGGGAASSLRRGRERRRPRLRLGAARQRRDPAPRAGGDRPLLGARARRTRSCRSTTWARAGCRTRCPSSLTAPAARRARSTCARCRTRSPACRRARSGATSRRSATCSRSRPTASPRFRAMCERERCPFAVVGTATADGRLVVDDPQFGNRPVDMRPRRAARQAAEDAARRDARRAAPAGRSTLDGVELERGGLPRAARADGRRQDLPRHDRRPHRRRPVRARPDGRAVAGAGGRLRGDAARLRRLRAARRWRSASARRSR